MPRLSYIDICKGILIILVAFGHIPYEIGLLGKDYPYVFYPFNTVIPFYAGIYMQAFFILSGYTSNFSKPFSSFFLKNVKGILVPCFVLGTLARIIEFLLKGNFSEDILPEGIVIFYFCENLWFLWAMFLVRIMYWAVCHFTKRLSCKGVVMLLVLIIGLYIEHLCGNSTSVLSYNFCFYRTAMRVGIFLWIGEAIKNCSLTDCCVAIIGLVYIPLLLLSRFEPLLGPISLAGAGGGIWRTGKYLSI